MRSLLLFDLNGVLANKLKHSPKCPDNDMIITIHHNYHWIIKSEIFNLLKNLSFKYDVGVWTSTPRENSEKLVEFLFQESNIECAFFFDRSHCDRDFRQDCKYQTIKLIDKIKEIIGNRKVIIIDDTLTKVNLNNTDSYICIDPKIPLLDQLGSL